MAMQERDAAEAAAAVSPPQEVLSVHGRRRQADRLQGSGDAQGLRHRDRQDRAEPHHRHEVLLSAAAGGRHQARALPGAAALHRPALKAYCDGSHSPAESRQPRQHRRPGQGALRLRPQLPPAPGQGDARHRRQHRAVRGAPRRARAPGARAPVLGRRARRGHEGLQAHHPRQGRHRGQAVRLHRHQRHRRSRSPAPASRWSAAKCACRAARCAWWASTRSTCTCTPTSTCRCT